MKAADLPAFLDELRAKGAQAVKLRLSPSGAVLGFECVIGPRPAPPPAKPAPRRQNDFVPPPAPPGLGYT